MKARGMCTACYDRRWKTGDLDRADGGAYNRVGVIPSGGRAPHRRRPDLPQAAGLSAVQGDHAAARVDVGPEDRLNCSSSWSAPLALEAMTIRLTVARRLACTAEGTAVL